MIAARKCKSIVAMVPCKKKKNDTKIIESDSDKVDKDNNFLASCGKALQPDPFNI